MSQENLKKRFMKYVSLNVIGMIGLSCYILADTFFVANGVGIHGLTALNLAIPIYSFIHGTGLMIGMGGATRFAISNPKHIFTQSLYYVGIASILFLTLGIYFTEPLAQLLGGNLETMNYTVTYLKTILYFSPMFLLNNVMICFVRNDGNPQLSMMAMLIGSLSNIILDYIFVYPLDMGMFGAAFATGLAPVISLLCLSKHVRKKKNTFKIVSDKLKIKALKDISLLGSSALICEFSSGVVIIVFNMLILNLAGNTGVAAYGIIANIALIVVAIFTGISQGMQPLISSSFSKSNYLDLKKVLTYGFIVSSILAMLIFSFLQIFAEPVVLLFNPSKDGLLNELAMKGLKIYSSSFILMGINIISASYFSSSDQPKNAFVLSLLRGFIVLIPMSILLSSLFGITGIWLTLTCSEFIVLCICMGLFKKSALHKKQ